jgi:hypothetical protein
MGGPAVALAVDAGRSHLLFLWPDERQLKVAVNVTAEPVSAVFVGDEHLVIWLPGVETKPGTVATVALSTAAQGRTSISPSWQLPVTGTVTGLAALDNAVAVITAAVEGLPDTCTVLASDTGKTLWQVTLPAGVFTAWGGATPSGALALAGVEYDGAAVRAFVRLHSATGKLLSSLWTSDGPAYLVRPSATGRYVLAVTPGSLLLADSEGKTVWTARFPQVGVQGAVVGPEGHTLVVTSRNTLVLDQRGAVTARWRTRGPWQAVPAAGGRAVAVGLLDGVAVLDLTGRVTAVVRGNGAGVLGVASDSSAMCRTTDTELILYGLGDVAPR